MLMGGKSGIKIKQSERLKSVHMIGALLMDTSLNKLLTQGRKDDGAASEQTGGQPQICDGQGGCAH